MANSINDTEWFIFPVSYHHLLLIHMSCFWECILIDWGKALLYQPDVSET